MGQVFCPEVSNTGTDLRAIQMDHHLKRAEQSRPVRRPTNPASKDDFNFIKVIGLGSYGKVFLVQHKRNARHFAMKVIKKELVFRTCQDEGIKGKSPSKWLPKNFPSDPFLYKQLSETS